MTCSKKDHGQELNPGELNPGRCGKDYALNPENHRGAPQNSPKKTFSPSLSHNRLSGDGQESSIQDPRGKQNEWRLFGALPDTRGHRANPMADTWTHCRPHCQSHFSPLNKNTSFELLELSSRAR